MNKNNFLKNLRKKDPKALEYVFDNYKNLIFKVSYSVLNNRELSKECINEVLFKIWNNIHVYKKGEKEFKSWVIAISRYTAIDILRKEKRQSNVKCSLEEVGEVLDFHKYNSNEELPELLLSEIDNLDHVNKEILIKRYILGYKVKEISEQIGINENAISSRIKRFKNKMLLKFKGDVI